MIKSEISLSPSRAQTEPSDRTTSLRNVQNQRSSLSVNSISSYKPPLTTRQALVPLTVMTISGCLQGLGTGFSITLNKHFQDTLHLSKTASTGIQIATAMAYLFGAPTVARYVLQRWGYRWCLIMGLLTYSIGAILFWPSGQFWSFPSYCVSTFIMAFGKAGIEMAENPYVATCGPPRYAELRVNAIQALKAICAIGSAVLASYILFPDHVDNVKSSRSLMYVFMADGALNMLLALVFFLVGRHLQGGFPESSDAELAAQAAAACPTWKQLPLAQQKNLWMAVVSTFCFTGSAVASLAFFINYSMDAEHVSAQIATQRLSIGIAIYTVGRIFGTVAMIYFKPRQVILCFSLIACCLQIAACVPAVGRAGTWLLIVDGFFRACTHATTLTLAMKGLGKHTRLGVSFITAADCGGLLFAPLTGWVMDKKGPRLAQVIPTLGLALATIYPLWIHLSSTGEYVDKLSSVEANERTRFAAVNDEETSSASHTKCHGKGQRDELEN